MSERKPDIMAEVLRMLQHARPEQIKRLLDDMAGARDTGGLSNG